MLTESRRRTCKSSGGSGRLGALAVEDGGDMRRVTGDAYGVCYSWTVWWFGPQTIGRTVSGFGPKTLAEVPRRNGVARGGITEVTSRRSKSVQKVRLSYR